MQNKSLKLSAAWPYLVAACILLLISGLIFMRPIYQRAILSEGLARASRMMQIGYASHIELDQFTDFDWTEVYVFGPYTPKAAIEDAIGDNWSGSERITYSDAINLLVFMNGDRMVQWVEVNRGIMDFAGVSEEGPFTPETALFIMLIEGDSNLTLLR